MNAIVVEQLGKRYVIGHQVQHDTLRDAIMHRLRRGRAGDARPAQEDFWALRDVGFEVKAGEVIGIVGANGAGKSTLLKILSRITEPTTGRVTLRGRVASLLEVGTGFHPELSGRENIFLNGAILGMSRAEIRRKFDEIVAFAEIERFLDTPVKRYSSGMYVRLAFAVAAHLDPEILIVDEVLAVGDAQFQAKCLGKMNQVASGGRTVLFVSHNLGAMLELCQTGLLLKAGRMISRGPIRDVVRDYRGAPGLNHRSFDAGPLRELTIEPRADALQLTARWQSDLPLDLPALGFVIYDELGRPVFGANPRHLAEGERPPCTAGGRISVRVSSPSLRPGNYTLSAWFGDSRGDQVEHPHCLTFKVEAAPGDPSLLATTVGSVQPRCAWQFGA